MSLNLKERRNKTGTVLVATGEINSETSGTLLETLLPLVREGRALRIDLTAVTYVSSAGLRTLLVVYREAQHAGVAVTLYGVSEEVRFVMSATGFLDFFETGQAAAAAGRARAAR
ncbi:anti-sigma B factor antagonist [Streptomyces sp. 3211.6]|uniref:STAS domain-containing protein n=1 Tax=Streptomyces TaxID=1883 RepID=UPI0009A4B9FD|nr:MULTISPECIES: STAS domain-containing protein [Streptomyces]RKT03619.1 anti-sigma B factor antagonist [Streptomyces sp. 3211.6]RPF39488.1 anti-sigma B factor antagonist [Streptomyces sp. Ag109_G2-6]